MCGIVGIFNYSKKEKINENLLIKMRDTMVHRGPDGYGLWISPDEFTGIGHRRLSIIDISKSATNSLWVILPWREILKLYELNKKYDVNFLKKAGLAGLKIAGRKEKSYYERLKRGTENKPIFWGGIEAFFDNSKKALLSDKYKKDFKNYTSYEAIKPIYDRFNEKAWE